MYDITGTFTSFGTRLGDTADYQRAIPAGPTLAKAVANARKLYDLGKSDQPPARGVFVAGHGRTYEVYADTYFLAGR